MLIGLLTTVLILDGILIIFLVLLQKGKGGIGLAGLGGGAQMLFGGSGGQDIFQKITWVLGAIFMGGSLLLAILKTQLPQEAPYAHNISVPTRSVPQPQAPVNTTPPAPIQNAAPE